MQHNPVMAKQDKTALMLNLSINKHPYPNNPIQQANRVRNQRADQTTLLTISIHPAQKASPLTPQAAILIIAAQNQTHLIEGGEIPIIPAKDLNE